MPSWHMGYHDATQTWRALRSTQYALRTAGTPKGSFCHSAASWVPGVLSIDLGPTLVQRCGRRYRRTRYLAGRDTCPGQIRSRRRGWRGWPHGLGFHASEWDTPVSLFVSSPLWDRAKQRRTYRCFGEPVDGDAECLAFLSPVASGSMGWRRPSPLTTEQDVGTGSIGGACDCWGREREGRFSTKLGSFVSVLYNNRYRRNQISVWKRAYAYLGTKTSV